MREIIPVKTKSTKVVIKVLDPILNKIIWVHLCYIEKELYLKYLKDMDITSNDLNRTICRWVKEDYSVELQITTTEDIAVLRTIVKDFYSRTYPEVFIDSLTDKQGWLRVWITRKMKEDLGIYER